MTFLCFPNVKRTMGRGVLAKLCEFHNFHYTKHSKYLKLGMLNKQPHLHVLTLRFRAKIS